MGSENVNVSLYRKLMLNTELRSLSLVGRDKPLGYVVADQIKKSGFTSEQLKTHFQSKGLEVIEEKFPDWRDKAFFVYDKKALLKLLKENEETLDEAGIQLDCESFIQYIGKNRVPNKTKLYTVIADAFDDFGNPGRIDIEDLGMKTTLKILFSRIMQGKRVL